MTELRHTTTHEPAALPLPLSDQKEYWGKIFGALKADVRGSLVGDDGRDGRDERADIKPVKAKTTFHGPAVRMSFIRL